MKVIKVIKLIIKINVPHSQLKVIKVIINAINAFSHSKSLPLSKSTHLIKSSLNSPSETLLLDPTRLSISILGSNLISLRSSGSINSPSCASSSSPAPAPYVRRLLLSSHSQLCSWNVLANSLSQISSHISA